MLCNIDDYSYDQLSRLIEADYNDGSTVYNYGYDVAGNMVDYDGVTRTYNEANQMTYDGTNTLTYDNNGNLKNDGTNTYTWDRANRLTDVGNHSYVYDGLGARVQQTVSSIVTDYLNDVQPGLTKLLKQTTGANVEQFVHGVRGIHAVDDGTDWSFYAQDGLGSVRAVVDDAGVVQSSMSYDPYGNPMGAYGEGFGFTGEQTDADGSVFLRARYYEPGKGSFIKRDPAETPNRYVYVSGNPVNFTDATGLCPENPPFWNQHGWNCIRNAEWMAARTDEPLEYWMQFSNGELERRQTSMQFGWLGSFLNNFDPIEAGRKFGENTRNALGCVPGLTNWFFNSQTQSAMANEAITGLADGFMNNSLEAQREAWGGVNDFVGYNLPELLLDLVSGPLIFDELNDVNRVTQQVPVREASQEYTRRILVLGEESDAPYAQWLANQNTTWEVWGTRYGTDSQVITNMDGNFILVDNVDGTALGSGSLTGGNRFDDIIFNGPRADAPPRPPGPHRNLVVNVLDSSQSVLSETGVVRISSSGGMPAGFFLQGLATGNPRSTSLLPTGITFIEGGLGAPTKGRPSFPFLDNSAFGWPDYIPLSNGGTPLRTPVTDIYWYLFGQQ